LDREEAPVVPAASKATSENHPADVVPAKETSPAGSSEAAGNSAGQFALLEAERQRLEHFIQQQLDNLREARQGLLAEKQANEQALETRRQELEHQGQLLMTRLKELHEREQQQADRIDDALPERHANYRRRRFSSLIDKSKITEEPDPEIKALRERLQESQQILVLAQGERDAAWDELATLRSQARQMENTIAERDAALAKWQQSHAKPESSPSPEADPIRLKRQAEEIETLWRQVQEQRQLLERVRKDHDAAREALVQEWQRKLEQLKAERDAAREENDRLAQEPPEAWAQQEEEYATLTRELRAREAELKERLQFLSQEQQRLEKLRAESNDRNRLLDRDRQELEEQARQLLLREERARLREAELSEMRELAEQENARERAGLLQERAQIARLREALRHEKAKGQETSKKSGS
jgi:hypothetical protein